MELTRASGFNLESQLFEGALTSTIFEELLHGAINGKVTKARIDQLKVKKSRTEPPKTFLSRSYLSNEIRKKRIPLKNYDSLPYGWKLEMLSDLNLLIKK